MRLKKMDLDQEEFGDNEYLVGSGGRSGSLRRFPISSEDGLSDTGDTVPSLENSGNDVLRDELSGDREYFKRGLEKLAR